METLDQVTICSPDRQTDFVDGELKIGRDYACIYATEVADNILPDWDVRGCSVVASHAGEVQYTGEIVGVSVYETSDHARTTFRCKPAEPHGG